MTRKGPSAQNALKYVETGLTWFISVSMLSFIRITHKQSAPKCGWARQGGRRLRAVNRVLTIFDKKFQLKRYFDRVLSPDSENKSQSAIFGR